MTMERTLETVHKEDFSFSTSQVLSADRTVIGYRQVGSGPGLVILHGGGRASQHYLRLAQALADRYSVFIPDRRGRGLSGPAGEKYSLQTERDDLRAVLLKTGARRVFGHSAGGVIGLEAALALPVEKLAVYEPAVPLNGSLPLGWLPAFERALEQQDSARAMAIFMKGLRLNWMSGLPLWLLTAASRPMMAGEYGREMVDLLPTLVWEVKMIQALAPSVDRYRAIQAQTLMIGGSKSPAYLKEALPVLAKTIPYAHWVIFPGLNHNAPDQYEPELIAAELKRFFL